jgi:RNA polymerase sigma-70 factor (ECF subfamily)
VGRVEDLERLYRERGNRLWWALLAFTGDREVTNDAMAEAFAQALRRGDRIRAPERWVTRAAFRIAAGELKVRRREVALTREDTYEMPEQARELQDALRRLPRKQRASVALHHLGGYPVREIAAIIGSTPAAVRVHLSQGRKRLRRILEEGRA